MKGVTEIKRLEWQWAGYVLRMGRERWTFKATVWIPYNCKRRRGYQVKQSGDEIIIILKEDISLCTLDFE